MLRLLVYTFLAVLIINAFYFARIMRATSHYYDSIYTQSCTPIDIP